MIKNTRKNILIACMIPCFASAQKASESAKLDFYRNGNARGLYYAEILIRNSNGNDKLNYERDFSARAFDYWILLRNNEINRDLLVEARVKKALLTNAVRTEVWNDPLGRNQKTGHFAVSLKFAVTSANYAALVKDFSTYLKAMRNDGSVPNLE